MYPTPAPQSPVRLSPLVALGCFLSACTPATPARKGLPDDGSGGVGGNTGAMTVGGRGGRGGTAGSAATAGSAGGGRTGGAGQGGTASLDAAATADVRPAADVGDGRGSADTRGLETGGADQRANDGAEEELPPALELFQSECALCHGPRGEGSVNAPEIQHPVRDFATWVVRNGRAHASYPEPMPKFSTGALSNADLEVILAFLSALPKPTTGMGLFKDFCANCHGSDAKGGLAKHSLTSQPVTAFISNVRAGHHANEFSNRTGYMPKWTTAQLSDTEIRLIFSYVDGL